MASFNISKRSWFGASLMLLGACIATPEDVQSEQPAAEGVSIGRNQAALVSTCTATTPINALKELFLVDPSVVNAVEARNDTGATGGELSFRRTMTTLAAGQDVAVFTENFLKNWRTTQTVGRGQVEARPGIEQLLDPSVGLWSRTADGKLDMSRAPFRLLGVVNRMDLFGTAANKPNGEGRLIYGLFAPQNGTFDPATGNGLPMTIIFEFNLPASHSLRDWATRWHQLAAQPFGFTTTGMRGANFNDILFGNVVNEFVAPQNLSQVRTNEIFLGSPWQLREFNLVNGALVAATTKQSPEQTLNDSAELINWIKANKNAILSNTHVVPDSLLGGRANEGFPSFGPTNVDGFENTRWLINSRDTNGIEESVRFAFASQTCNGCHNSDVSTNSSNGSLQFFYQVVPNVNIVGTDGSSRLSPFIQNQELPSRAKILSGLLSCGCIAQYNVVSRWDSGTTSSVTVTNIGSTAVSNWDVKWTYASSETVTSNWESNRVAGVNAPNFEFTNLAWNGAIAPGGHVQFGINTSTSGLSPMPTSVSVSCQ